MPAIRAGDNFTQISRGSPPQNGAHQRGVGKHRSGVAGATAGDVVWQRATRNRLGHRNELFDRRALPSAYVADQRLAARSQIVERFHMGIGKI